MHFIYSLVSSVQRVAYVNKCVSIALIIHAFCFVEMRTIRILCESFCCTAFIIRSMIYQRTDISFQIGIRLQCDKAQSYTYPKSVEYCSRIKNNTLSYVRQTSNFQCKTAFSWHAKGAADTMRICEKTCAYGCCQGIGMFDNCNDCSLRMCDSNVEKWQSHQLLRNTPNQKLKYRISIETKLICVFILGCFSSSLLFLFLFTLSYFLYQFFFI